MDEGKRWYWQALLLGSIAVLLFYTNPSRDELSGFAEVSNSASIWSIPKLFHSNLRKLFVKEEFRDLLLASIVRHGESSVSVGIAGFWIRASYWTTIPAWFLIFQLLWSLVNNARLLGFYWAEFTLSALWFIFITQQLQPQFYVEKYESTFYLLTSFCTYAIAHLVLFPSSIFKKRNLQPGSMVYGAASAVLVYLTLMQDRAGYAATFRWQGLNVSYAQLSLAVIALQLLLGSSMGFAGSLAGVVMYALVVGEVLVQERWR